MNQNKQHGLVRRATVGVAKAWAYSIGLTSLAREGQRIGGNIAAAAAYVHRQLTDGPENYRHETFEAAVERLNLDEAHLVKQAQAFSIRANSWLAASMLSTVWLAYTLWSNAPVPNSILCIGLIFMTSSKGITFRFRYCQIRDQCLYGFGPWFRNPGRW